MPSAFFQFGPGTLCYGQPALDILPTQNGHNPIDLSRDVRLRDSALELPFDASKVIENLRFERYPISANERTLCSDAARKIYYSSRPYMGTSFRRMLQRLYFRNWNRIPFPRWPVDTTVEQIFERLLLVSMKLRTLDRIPFVWFWPDGALGAAIVTHDVETAPGLNSIRSLMDIDDAFGIKSSFQLVPEERYSVSRDLIREIKERQCEVNVHGLNHRGNLFGDRQSFLKQAGRINRYVQEFGAEGFRSTCMYRNLDWYSELRISYDMSVPNVAHLEPQRGGCCTVFPYFIGEILELPLTTVQDYSLFHIIGDYSTGLWRKQIEQITEKHGLISLLIHPDYLLNQKALDVYRELLAYLRDLRGQKNIWFALPGEINRWWRDRNAMKLVFESGRWCVKGPGSERARVGFASIKDDRIVYAVELHGSGAARPELVAGSKRD